MKRIKYMGQAMAAMTLTLAMAMPTFAVTPADGTAASAEADVGMTASDASDTSDVAEASDTSDVSEITIDNASASQTEQIKGFVERLYSLVLGRASDPAGLEAWTDILVSGKEDGAKVALGFVDSDEFKSRSLSDTDYITVLYQTFLNREPDAAGLAAWQNVLANGFSRTYVFRGFAESDEFTDICTNYGIQRGNVTLTEARDQNDGITRFVTRAYKLCLGRSADVNGLNGWCDALLSGRNTAKEAACGFVFSDEFKSKNLSDEDFVKTMYNMFLDREPDTDGYNAWVKVLKDGGTREQVFNGFADSDEFNKLYASFLDGSYKAKDTTTDKTTDTDQKTDGQKKDEQTTPDTPKGEESVSFYVTDDVTELAARPAYGVNPEDTYWTTIPYLVTDAQMQFTATISTDASMKEFEVWCHFFEDQQTTVGYTDNTLSTIEDKTGFMMSIAPEIVQYAIDQNIWLRTEDCPAEYGVYSDPGDNPTAVNYVADDRPLYIQAGTYDEDFERANENLNGLATEIKDETLLAYEQPAAADAHGTVEAIKYDTYYYAKDLADGDALSHATPITKTAYVYLPADYDASKQYNILYLLHGGGDNAAKWFTQEGTTTTGTLGSGYAVNILDNLFANGDAESFIVVTPGLYYEEDENTQSLNGYTETFAYEFRDLMPVVESTYSTYAADTTDAGLIASRDHRAFAGLSMGSITTWHSGVAQLLDVVSWYGNMSAGPSADIEEATSYTNNTIIPAIEEAASKGYKINMLLSMNGVKDMALEPHVATHKLLVDFAETSDALTVGENYDFIASNGAHTFEAWNLYLYDMAQVFFK